MAKQILNTGTSNNDKSGDTLRAGGLKIKANFNEIYAALANDGSNISGGDLLKTGSYTDLRNLPDFKTISITGSFDDLVDVPEISTYVSPPPSLIGIDGNLRGQIAADDEYVYLCIADWAEADTYSPLTFVHEDNLVDYLLVAATSDVASSIVLKPGTIPPEVDYTITDGTTTRTITLVTEIGDGDGGVWYQCTLDGEFTSVANTSYTIAFAPSAGQFAVHFTWNGTFQPIVDAHAQNTLAAKLYKSGDSVGRVITHAVRDSITNQLSIVYSGEQFTSFTGMSIVNDQPTIWKRVPLTGGSGNTGDITFNGVKIIGAGTDSGDGYGYSTLELVPDNSLYDIQPGGDFGYGGQYLIIDPTSPNHIHIRAGGPQDQASAQLIVGGELANITVRDQDDSFDRDHSVFINTYDHVEGTYFSWKFNSQGAIVFPDNSIQTTGIAQGQHLFLMDEVNIASTLDAVDFNLLLATPAIGYMGSDTHTITIPNGTPGQRLIVVNNSTLCTVEIGPHSILPEGKAEFIFTSGTFGDGWIPLYGTV
jgi:hypothetical protein